MQKIYNTLTRNKQIFKPIIAGQVSMYVCGMTVYDYCHLGHARVMVVFDSISRWFRETGYAVNYVRNITDIDDKIIKRATENNETIGDLTQRFIDAMNADSDQLGIIRPTAEPRATAHIIDMINMIATLIDKGHAYKAANGDVFYSVRSFNEYGKLSGKSLDDLRAGERVEIDTQKIDPLDFVLWKAVKPNEPSWDSPFGGPNNGKGRPGWHIECSAMSAQQLGAHFDIHGGGQDLQFPHHENEIAQSEAAHNCQMANFWMHNGFVRVDDEKMSKSLGNFFTIRSVLEKYDAEVVRFFILRAHYRSALNYSHHHLDDANASLTRLYTSLRGHFINEQTIDWNDPQAARFKHAMEDDFNTPEAMAVLFELASEINKTQSLAAANLLKKLGAVIGLLQREPDAFLQRLQPSQSNLSIDESGSDLSKISPELSLSDIEALITLRANAKKERNFAQADQIRDQLTSLNIILEDSPNGTSWRRN